LCGNRNIKDILIVGNTIKSYALTIRNGIPIKDYYGDEDEKLIYLGSIDTEDVREVIKQDFVDVLLD
jgi:TFIIF-interacting CTD phosphatase-like protein